MKVDKYALYERAVQSPRYHAQWLDSIYQEIKQRTPERLREDFCGTFSISCEWAKLRGSNTAYGVDLDPEPLAYGKKNHLKKLTPEQRSRVRVFRQDVLKKFKTTVDVIAACNFSFFIFQRRKELLNYFRACLGGLKKDGILVLEMAGGPGMIESARERKHFKKGSTPAFTYIWDQQSFNPITRRAHYSIHFLLKNGPRLQDAFHYDWRMWTVPEIRDALIDAGFKNTRVYWESEHEGEGTGEYIRAEEGDNAYAWIAYVVGEK